MHLVAFGERESRLLDRELALGGRRLHDGLGSRGDSPCWLLRRLSQCLFRRFNKRNQIRGCNAERASREAVNIRGIDPDHFALLIKHWTAAAATRSGCVIDQLVSAHITDMS